nr:phosphodiester glycosidase family protein [Ruminiclostridium cellobioparum]
MKADGKMVLIVVDGRQPGYSTGMTGKELAEYLIRLGVEEAAMLDGGATSQMLVEGSLKNRPSDRGLERPVAGAFIVKLKDT